ncbi:MAG: GNAT family N-acetyltransferase [Isosphaeraceae bacterium]
MPVILIGTLDTKGKELAFVRDRLRAAGLATLVIDAGSVGPPAFPPDIDRERVFFRAGADLDAICRKGDRGEAVSAAAQGVASLVSDLHAQGQVDGILAIGGSAGTTIGTAAMRALPVGIPKVMVSTLASGQTRPFVGGSDIAMFHSVADIAGLNRLTRTILINAAYAMAGMLMTGERILRNFQYSPIGQVSREAGEGDFLDDPEVRFIEDEPPPDRPVIAATMFGVTTPCVDHARRLLESLGFEVWVFHATGVGGQAMEGLIRDGQVQGVLDLTTTEVADERVGGVLSAGPDRLDAAGKAGIPQVVSLGALDMVNFGPKATVPERFQGRKLHVHNANVTLMRTTPEENAELGAWIASKLRNSTGPTALIVPRGGVSGIDAPDKPFWDPEADAALFRALEEGLEGDPRVRLIERPENINDPAFAEAAALALVALMGQSGRFPAALDALAPQWADARDLPGIKTLLHEVRLPIDDLADRLDGFLVIRGPNGRILATAGLERHGPVGYLRSVAVHPELQRFGLGSRLVAMLLNHAGADGLEEVALQTQKAAAFFAHRFQFEPVERASVDAALASSIAWHHECCETATVMRRRLSAPEEPTP